MAAKMNCLVRETHGVVTPDPFILSVAQSRDQFEEHALLVFQTILL